VNQPSSPPPHSVLSILALVLAILGFVAGIFPFAGVIGTVGLILALVDRNSADPPDRPQRHDLASVSIVLGTLSTLGALVWGVFFLMGLSALNRGSCPHLYAHDGEGYKLDADLASGALYKGAERDDTDRLESLREVDGAYLLRLQNDLDEVDHIDSLSLLVVDAPEGAEVLPTPTQRLLSLRTPLPLQSAVDAGGRSVTDELSSPDGRAIGVERGVLPGAGREPRDTWTLSFGRPEGRRAFLVIRGRNTDFAEEAFIRYMATMGQGVRPLLELSAENYKGCACYQDYVASEIERMGFPLRIQIAGMAAVGQPEALPPVGPAILRSQVVPVELPAGAGPVEVRLEATPRFWEIDQVALFAEGHEVTPQEIRPQSARSVRGDELNALLANDGQRVVLQPGERVDLRFAAPQAPAAGLTRTVVAQLRGYYDLDIGGPVGVNTAQIVAHHMGWTSLPRFAERLP
jgi:hypothetical protein